MKIENEIFKVFFSKYEKLFYLESKNFIIKEFYPSKTEEIFKRKLKNKYNQNFYFWKKDKLLTINSFKKKELIDVYLDLEIKNKIDFLKRIYIECKKCKNFHAIKFFGKCWKKK